MNGTAYAYDANGNLVSDGSRTYVWDARNRLVQVKRGDSVLLDVGYDPLGRRSRKASEGADATTYLYDGIDMIARSGPEGSEFMINGLGVDEHLAALGVGGEHYFAVDGINSMVALTDGSGQATSRYAYDPYGTVQATGEDGESLLYMGRERDLADLYFYRARYYSPVSGRFVSSDPLGFGAGQLNFYAYVGNNPLNYTDPLGLWEWPALPQGFVNASAGFGDALSFGLTGWARHHMGIGSVDECSAGYSGGQMAGIVGGLIDGEGEAQILFKTGHYAPRLIAECLDVAEPRLL